MVQALPHPTTLGCAEIVPFTRRPTQHRDPRVHAYASGRPRTRGPTAINLPTHSGLSVALDRSALSLGHLLAHSSTGFGRRTDRGRHLEADRDIFINIFMPTTVHIPDPLLKSVDRRAKALGISRNRLVVRALEQAVSVRSGWAPEFLQRLRHVDRETSAAVDELLVAVTQARRSKEPRDL